MPDSLCIWRLAEELNETLAGGTVRRVLPAGAKAALLEIAADRRRYGLLVCWMAELARVHLVREAEPGRADPFAETLARQIEGAVVVGIRQQAFDRVVVVELANLENMGPEARGRLVIEATGRQANCLLIEADGSIAAVARPTPQRKDIYRVLAPGEQYLPPPGQDKLDPRDLKPEDLAADADAGAKSLLSFLRSRVQGISNALAAELGHRASLDLKAPLDAQPADYARRLAAAMAEIVDEARAGRAWLHFAPDGQPLVAYPLRLEHLLAAGARVEQTGDLSEAIEAVAAHIERARRVESLRGQVTGALRRELERKRRLVAKRRAELQQASEADKWQRWGELLLANLHAIASAPPGSVVRVVDYYSPDQREIEIPLAQGKGPKETAELYFHKHRRAKRAAGTLPRLIAEAEAEIRDLEEMLRAAQRSDDLHELAQMAREVGAGGSAEERPREGIGSQVGRTVAPTGHVVLFGRSARGNDEIVRMARPDDMWLHARGVKGAHVLIRLAPGEDPPRETLLFAARLAGKLSDYRRDGVADVDYTRARYVRKPRGSAPGFVTYTHQKTITVDLGQQETPRHSD